MTLIKQLHSVLEVRNNEFNALHSTLEDQKETIRCLENKVTELSTKSIALTNQTSDASNSAPQPVDGSQLEDRIKEVENTNYVLLHSIDDLEKEVKILQRKISKLTSCYECELCGKTFPTDIMLKDHLWQDHGQRSLFGS